MQHLALTIVLVAAAMSSPQSPADDAPQRSAELQVLERIIGVWDSVVTNSTTGETSATVENRRWSRTGHFVLSEDLNRTTGKEAHFLLTDDPQAKVYRTCDIDESNTATLLGTWDEPARTMTWTGTDADNHRLSGTYRFIDHDHVEWSLTSKDPAGTTIAHLTTKQTRRKE